MVPMIKAIPAYLMAALLAGCAASGTQVSQRAATQFKEGLSTEADIVAALGNPSSTTISSGMKTISYMGMQYKVKAETFIPIVGAFVGGADYTVSVASYQIGADGVLKTMSFTNSGSATRSGVVAPDTASGEPISIR